MIKRYKTERKMLLGVTAMEAQGWEVVDITAYNPKRGVVRSFANIATFGAAGAFTSQGSRFVVRFRRDESKPSLENVQLTRNQMIALGIGFFTTICLLLSLVGG